MIKNIIFDLGNVIVKFDKKEIISNFTNKEDEIEYIYNEIFDSPEWIMLDLGKITEEEAIEVINKRNNFKYEKLTNEFLHKWYTIKLINEDIVEIAKKIKQNGYNLFILSNISTDTYDYLKSNEFFSLCTGAVISGQEHIIKPDEKIYRILLDRYNLKPEECLFIDDDTLRVNYETAKRIGIKGRRITPNQAEDVKKLLEEYDVKI